MYSFLSIFEVSLECFVEPSETRQLISKFLSVLLSAFIGLLLLETLEMVIVNIFQKIKASSKQKNLPSLMRLILNIMRSLVFALTLLMILSELGFNITPLLASAGVLGLAISLGSQTLFNDLIKGFFILTEDTLTIGDTVSFYISSAEYRGVVENITLRNVQLRDEKDQVHTIPFSTIGPIINESRPKHEIA
ncbi:MAG: mechanosensitive ion channel [Caedimonadaceae bacterium]|nr:MAG: mechanosensitive ion channel [Caedimonadaceae bacterium]